MKKKLLALLLVFVVTTFSFSAISFASTPTNLFVGGQHYYGTAGNGVTSVYSDIFTPDYPAVYNQSASCAWPMITQGSKYVQVGWIKQQGLTDVWGNARPNGVHYFYEINYGWSSDGTTQFDYQTYNTWGPASNTTHGYRVHLLNGNYSGEVDGAVIDSYPTSISTYDGTKSLFGTGVQYYEEINCPQGHLPTDAQFAGSASNHARFSNVRAFYNNVTYYSPMATSEFSADNCGVYSLNWTQGVAASTFDCWDSRY